LFFLGLVGSLVGGMIFSLITGNGLDIAISGLIGSTIGAGRRLRDLCADPQPMAPADTSHATRTTRKR
jgi:hypothetical protein